MKRINRGPEIKLPKPKLPRFVVDVYRDLDDRHLLPLVALLLVAIVAVPFLLGNSDDSSTSEEAEGIPTPSVAADPQNNTLAVAKEAPTLRDYRRRLSYLTPKDPFANHSEANSSEANEANSPAPETAAEAEAEASEIEAAAIESIPSAPSEPNSSGGETPSSPETRTTKTKLTYFTYAIDVRVTPVPDDNNKKATSEPTVRRELPPLTMLPSRETPAFTYIGPTRDGEKALMLVSSEVTSMFGDSNCVSGADRCQLIALKPGLPETIVVSPNERAFRIELLKVQQVFSDHLEVAPLGDPRKNQKNNAG